MSAALHAAVEHGMPERPVPIIFVSFSVPGRVYGAKAYMDPEQAGKGEITIPHGILVRHDFSCMFCTIVFRGSVPALWLLTIAQSGRLGRRPRPTGSVTAYTENWIEMTGLFQTTLILATFLCSLVAGFLFAFSVVVMPGIKSLNDRSYLHAFQVMDRIIQNNQPVFVLVWVGSAIMLIASVVLGIGQLDAIGRILVICTALIYLLGVQLPTIVIHIPLNNKLQTLDIDAVTETASKAAREDFEPRWNRWNTNRAVLSSLVSALLIILLFRL